MANSFQQKIGESILYQSQPLQKWYVQLPRIGLEVFEVVIFLLLSFISFRSLSEGLLVKFLPIGLADGLSQVVFQGIVPILIVAWFVEDTARIFTSELVLTSQRMWMKGSPFAWSPERETPLTEIKSITYRREAIFIQTKDTKRVQVHVFPDGKEIAQAFTQFTGKSEGD
jgi:hypothetical protein